MENDDGTTTVGCLREVDVSKMGRIWSRSWRVFYYGLHHPASHAPVTTLATDKLFPVLMMRIGNPFDRQGLWGRFLPTIWVRLVSYPTESLFIIKYCPSGWVSSDPP